MSQHGAPQGGSQGIIGQTIDSATNAVNYVTESVSEAASGASKEGNKEQAKGNVPGKDGIGDRVSGALSAGSDKLDETSHSGKKEANKEAI